ncbi:MAG TPA: DNA-3-methyladenine glycosylase 2 family protein [Candidatus Dormibacteraeota bacterium]|jgi:DNA-3-methyladenine glycosylase II|nr:DNA-3-methyladenine glycosylase 2 family protein [Candidatus Dormibacteraeota bacterium]
MPATETVPPATPAVRDRFQLHPRGPFSLALAAGHEFGPRRAPGESGVMRLAFCLDSLRGQAGVLLRQAGDGSVHGRVVGGADPAEVAPQVARILSLDHDGAAWPEVGRTDPVLGRLQALHHGFRPVLFCSPYEAACWGVIAGHRRQLRALPVRRALCRLAGAEFDLEGVAEPAFPTPEALLRLDAAPELDREQIRRLHGIAEAALEGRLDPSALRRMEPEEAREQLRSLPGIGPFYSGLILVRAAGPVDCMVFEPRLLRAVAHYYRRPGTPAVLAELGERWRPFRSWAAVLIRRAGHVELGSNPPPVPARVHPE